MPTIFRFQRASTSNVSSAILDRGAFFIDNDRNSGRGLVTLHDGVTPGGLDVGFWELANNDFIFLPNTEWSVSIGKSTSNENYKLDVNGSIQFSNSINNSYLNGSVNGSISINLGAAGNVESDFSTNAGGLRNKIVDDYCFIGGGSNNVIANTHSSISGGNQNKITSKYSSINGGLFNTINIGHINSLSGGSNNVINQSDYCFIGSGKLNYIDTVDYSSIVGGFHNHVNGYFSSVLGGYKNVSNGNYSTVLGGSESKSLGDHSLTFGNKAISNHDGSVLFKDSYNTPVSTFTDDSFVLCFHGGIYFKCGNTHIQETLLPTVNLHSDIGSPSKYINNIYANNINLSGSNYKKYRFVGNQNTLTYSLPNNVFYAEDSTLLFVDQAYWDYYTEVQNANGTFNQIEIYSNYPIPTGANCVLRFWRNY